MDYAPFKRRTKYESRFLTKEAALFHIRDDKYVFVGKDYIAFSANDGDVIQKFSAPVVTVGEAKVPLACAMGKRYVYLLLDKVFISCEDIKAKGLKMDPVALYTAKGDAATKGLFRKMTVGEFKKGV